jgi:hypothetical protein
MATCPHADRIIPLLHDNELQNPLRREMVTHMATCVTCARTFSLLEREQELFTQTIEECVDSVDFSGFLQAVEMRLSEPALSWAARLRLWYESWQPAWSFPIPAWAVAVLLLFLVPTHLALNNSSNNPSPSTKNDPLMLPSPTFGDPSNRVSPLPPIDVAQAPHETPHERTPLDPHSIQEVGLNDNQAQNDDQARIDSLYTYGSGTIAIHILHDSQSNSTVISYGDGASESPQ